MSWTRRWHRAGSLMLLVAAGTHLGQHLRAYVWIDDLDAPRRAAVDALQAYVLYAPWHVTLWTALGFFSLAYAGLLALLGTTHWILARESDPRTLRRHAVRNAVLGAMLTAAAALLHPLPSGLLVLGLVTVLFALAAWPRPLDH